MTDHKTERLSASSFAPRIVVTAAGCWQWTGARSGGRNGADGYGRVRIPGTKRSTGAHRAVYEELVGPIPEGTELDHLCRYTLCVNPDHLEPVTHMENLLRGSANVAQRIYLTHCTKGLHEYTPENTMIVNGGRHRLCRACTRDRMRRWHAARKAAA